MKHISIIVPAGDSILDTIVGSYNLFKMANSYARKIGKTTEDMFEIDLVALDKEPINCHKFFEVKPTKSIDEVERTDVIVLTSITGNIL